MKQRRFNLILVLLGLFLLGQFHQGCRGVTGRAKGDPSGTPAKAARQSGAEDQRSWYVGRIIEGEASWYGKDFHGKLTANGETFDMNDRTAAHKSMPLGSIIRVTNLANKQSVDVRVNDRGPYAKGRILDLSYAAAKAVGYANLGTAYVRAELLELGDNRYKGGGVMPLPEDVPDGGGVEQPQAVNRKPRLIVGRFNERLKAEKRYYYLRGRFSTISIEGDEGDYRVYIGPFKSKEIMRRIESRLKREGYPVELE